MRSPTCPDGELFPTAAAPGERATWRAWAGPAVTLGGTALAQWPLVPVWLVMALLTSRTDASGQGAVFRACTADSLSCTGPQLGAVAVLALMIAGVCAVIAVAGARVGRYRHRRRAFLVHWASSAGCAVATIAIIATAAGAPIW